MERWKTITTWDAFEVSDLGRVRRGSRVLAGFQHVRGYWRYNLCQDGRHRQILGHVLVAEAFLPPRPSPCHRVNHKDDNKKNNRAENLEWKTNQENCLLAHQTGAWRNRLAPEDVREIRRSDDFQRALADRFGVCRAFISMIQPRKKYGWVP